MQDEKSKPLEVASHPIHAEDNDIKDYLENKTLLSEADAFRILHELELHQKELEMQNQELLAAEYKAKIAADKYSLLYNSVSAGFFTLDRNGCICEVNLSGASMLQKDRQALINCNFIQFVNWDTRIIFHDFLMKLFETHAKETCEVRLAKNGDPFLDVYLEGILSDDGMGCLVTAIDITDRKQVEAALRISEIQYRRLYESMMDGYAYVDMHGYIGGFNESFRQMVGYTFDELSRLTYKDLTPERWHAFEGRLIQNQVIPIGYSQVYEKEYRKKDGTIFPVELRTFLIKNERGENEGMWAIVRDITERKLSEKRLLELNNKLKSLNDTKDKLFSIIAHDLKTPFNSMMGFFELFCLNLRRYDLEKSEKFIELINASAKHTLALLENLLAWANSQSGQIEYNPENVNLLSTFQEIVDLLYPSAKLKNITVNNCQTDDWIAYADRNMLQTILRNLISNAIKFTNSGGVIDVYATRGDQEIIITIADTGVGISDEIQNKLFRMDTNCITYGTANEKGSGLGLILCNEFVEKHGGKIWVESKLGQGSKFHFTIPANI